MPRLCCVVYAEFCACLRGPSLGAQIDRPTDTPGFEAETAKKKAMELAVEMPTKADASLKCLNVAVNRTHFAERYESSILALEELTSHQEEKLADCERAGDQVDIHIMAPAGAGKTFVALHLMLRTLRSSDQRVLFVARSPALCFFVTKWLAK